MTKIQRKFYEDWAFIRSQSYYQVFEMIAQNLKLMDLKLPLLEVNSKISLEDEDYWEKCPRA
jgi:hypothetical protein